MFKAIATLAACAFIATASATPPQRSATAAGSIYGGAVASLDWGRPVTAGDLDGDGYDDVIVGASKSYGDVLSKVYIVRGGPAAHGRGYTDLSVTPADQVILGATLNDNLGSSIATGDVNGDQIDDLVICASSASYSGVEGRGIAYVIFGGANFFANATRDLAVTTNWDMRILGPVAYGDMGGYNAFGGLDAHAAAVGRLNNDIYGDIILGVHLADGAATGAGRVYVLFGGPFPSGYTWNLAAGGGYNIRIDGKGQYDELGTVVLAGDLTGDGLDELIIPNEFASKSTFSTEGAVNIFRGRATWSTYYALTTPADITIRGARSYDSLGVAAVVGDFNNDTITDLAVAAPGADEGAWTNQIGDGYVYGFLGSTAYQTGTYTIDYATATPDFQFIGEYQEDLGDELSAGDFNGDGIPDIAACERFGGPNTNGVVEVLYGRDFAQGATFHANVNSDLRIVGEAQDRIGFSLAASDVNGDGRSEVLFGTPFNNSDRGTIYAFTYLDGDVNYDGDTDLLDFAILERCYNDVPPPGLTGDCTAFDFDFDEDVDYNDFVAFEPLLLGPQ